MSAKSTFRCPRLTDQEIITRLRKIAQDLPIANPQVYFIAFPEASGIKASLGSIEQQEVFKELLLGNSACAPEIRLVIPFTQQQGGDWHVLHVVRVYDDLFDEVKTDWQPVRGLTEQAFAKIQRLAREEFGEIKIGEALTGFPNETINKYLEARDATLNRLEEVSSNLLIKSHQLQAEAEESLQKRIDKLNEDFETRRAKLQGEFDERTKGLSEREEEFKRLVAEFDTRDSKVSRRQLRRDMLETLNGFKTKFELTSGTKSLRLPILVFSIVLLLLFGSLMTIGFWQTFEIVASQEFPKINWAEVAVLAAKQLGFTAAFVAIAWFFIRWNDKWFHQHADAEFMFKRMELDINRASWVVEMALEWKAEKGSEIPEELLDRLTRNLFTEAGHSGGEDGESPLTIADIILGSAANAKLKLPGGGEIELDRKGLQKAISQTHTV